jgi:molecular chaperone GrpE
MEVPVVVCLRVPQPLLQQQQQHRWFSSSSTEEEKKEEEAPAPSQEEEEDAAPITEEDSAAAAIAKQQLLEEQHEEEVKTLKNQLLRSLAEQENTRQIARKDVESARNFAIKSFAKSLLEVSDNLQRAMDSTSEDELETNTALQTLYQGIDMTNQGLIKAFASNGLKKYCELPGDVFDPTKHEALMEYPDPSKEPGTVGQVIKAGFTLNDRVLRHAEVGVVKKE